MDLSFSFDRRLTDGWEIGTRCPSQPVAGGWDGRTVGSAPVDLRSELRLRLGDPAVAGEVALVRAELVFDD